MDREFVFHTGMVEDYALPQLAAALEDIAESRSRQACPRLWGVTDRVKACRPEPSQGRLTGLLPICNYVLGFLLLVLGLLGDMLPLLFVGLAAWLWSLLRLRRLNPKALTLLGLVGGGLLTLAGILAPDRLGPILFPSLVAMATGFLSLFSHAPGRADSFHRAAAQLLEQRNRMPKGAVSFTDAGMSGREGGPVPYSQWEGCWETDDLLLPVCRDSILLLKKGELVGGDFPALRALLSEHITIRTL